MDLLKFGIIIALIIMSFIMISSAIYDLDRQRNDKITYGEFSDFRLISCIQNLLILVIIAIIVYFF